MSMVIEKTTPAPPLVTLHVECHGGDGVWTRAHRDGCGSDQKQRKEPGRSCWKGARGYGHSVGDGRLLAAARSLGPHEAATAWPPQLVCTKGCLMQSQDGFTAVETFLSPFSSLYVTACHKMPPGSQHHLETAST